MKATLYSVDGTQKGAIELPSIFHSHIRPDIVQKYFEASKFAQPYSAFYRAGLRQAAAGKISHKRHDWKGHYGRGIARIARKTMWRRGTQFFWIAANVASVRGGRKAHPPRGFVVDKKINKKETQIAMNSAFAATTSQSLIAKRYSTIAKTEEFPKVIESLPTKSKALKETLHKMFKDNFHLVFKNKEVRAGKGKLRGRKYKSNAGVLIITSEKENKKFKGLDVKTVKEVQVSDLYPLGRLTVFTHGAIKELETQK